MATRRQFCILLAGVPLYLSDPLGLHCEQAIAPAPAINLEETFKSPPAGTRPFVLWMWMGSNISAPGITRDLEAMKEAGIGGATIFSLADTLTPWAGVILKSPTPEIVTFTEPWWAMLRHAAAEAQRLGLELILFNCAGYESSGGKWITPELSMQEVVWSEERVTGGSKFTGVLKRPTVDPHPHALFPDVYIPSLGRIAVPTVEARQTYFRDIAVLALPSEGPAPKQSIVDLSHKMTVNGEIEWAAPEGDWTVYRFGHTTTGAMIQPAQWDAMGLECDKMSTEAVTFHVQHVLAELKKHLGDFLGTTVTTLYFDSYEAGEPTWTPKMREEFYDRRKYDITPWLPALAGRTVGSDVETTQFTQDFKRTVHDLYRDCYWATLGPLAHAAGLKLCAEPYEGPWEIDEVVQLLDTPAVEFWTTGGRYSPIFVDPVVNAARQAGDGIIAAESFTTLPQFAQWNAHPAWLKPIGDAAFCAGINRLNLHHFVQQPWDAQYKPGNAMGQWGIHFGRNQTWWKPGRAWITYLWRCQTLLQTGKHIQPSPQTSPRFEPVEHGPELQSIHRRDGDIEIYFVANVAWTGGKASCTFPVQGKQPELWDPVWGSMRDLADFEQTDGGTRLLIDFAPAQSFFFTFRRPAVAVSGKHPNVETLNAQRMIQAWQAKDVKFDYFTLDQGWPDNDGDLTQFASACYPDGPEKIVEGVQALDMKLGLWFSVSGGGWSDGSYPAVQTSAIPEPGGSGDPPTTPPIWSYRDGYPTAGGIGRTLCIASDPYFNVFKNAVDYHVQHNRVRLVKFDIGNYYCNSTAHQHLPGRYSTETMFNRLIDLARSARSLSEDVFVIWYWGVGRSPFWAMHGDVIFESGLFLEGSGTSWFPTIFYRDAVTLALDQSTVFAGLVPPLLKDSLGVWLSQIRWANFMGKERWREAMVMDLGRGNLMFPQIWGDPSLLNDDDLHFLSGLMALARANEQVLLKPRRDVGDPWKNTPYGYAFFDGQHGFVFLNNVHFTARKIRLPLSSELGLSAPSGTALRVVSHFPEVQELTAEDSSSFQSGETAEIWMRPFETLLLEIGAPAGAALPRRQINAAAAAAFGNSLELQQAPKAAWMELIFADADRFERERLHRGVEIFSSRLPALPEDRSILAIQVELSQDGEEYRHTPGVAEIVIIRARIGDHDIQLTAVPSPRQYGNTQHAGCSWVVYKIALGQALSSRPIEFAVHSYLPDRVEATTKAWVVKQWWQEDTRPEAEGYFADEPS